MYNYHMKPKSLGTLSILLSALLYSTYGLFIRNLSTELSIFPQLVLRGLIVSFLLLLIGYFSHGFKKIDTSDLKTFVLRSLAAFIDFVTIIVAFNNLPLGLTLFVFYAASVLSQYIFGYYVYHERITRVKMLCLLLAFVGLVFIYGNSFTSFALVPLLAAFASGTGFGLTMGLNKNLTEKYSFSQVGLFTNVFITLLAIPFVYFAGGSISFNLSTPTWYWLLGFSAVITAVSYVVLHGYKVLETQVASILLLAEILFALIIGYFFYQEIPTVATLIGGLCIVAALTLPNISKEE